ncbi:MATE family efflux transporter [Tropicibacter naphthalenivorans]|uniref:Multidrug-efflux transporter n=1 Tax=Tropicibacter naphthalenivorans TaxID=441103 RepID=A0A0P1GKN3_9RHOB|nr:MATE family efflux transporter [Tropicibacter naphthalenivorans]CUH82519.1 Multidrug-efflux transporter [Tropicibacter naphthalenivorans]SMD10674.1 multidrug resistance protein, MATE family [Tropicibacter naphthalenivorans]
MSFPQHIRAVLTLGLPLIGGHLAQFAIGLTDTIMMGWYGVPELAALTLASSFFFTVFLFGSGFAWAMMPMVATFAAQGDEVQIRRATRMALWLSILYFAVMMPLFWWSAPLLRAMGQPEDLAVLAQTYLRIAGFGMLPALGVMVLKNYLAGLEHTRVVLWVTVAAALANVVLNYALVFGNWGAPELGIRGAAIASVAVQVVSLVLIIAYALRILPQHALFQRFWRPDWEMFGQVFRLGLPIGLTTLAEVALFAGASVLMGMLGTVPLAAHGIVLQISTATFMMQMGLSNAATVRAGNALGRGDAQHMLTGAKAALTLGAVGVGLSIALFVTIPELLVGLFLDPNDPQRAEILAMGAKLMVLAALFQLVDATQVLHIGLLRGLHDTRVPMWVAAFAYWGVGMPAAAGLGIWLGWGAEGVWLGLTLGLTVAAVLLTARFWRHGASFVTAPQPQ